MIWASQPRLSRLESFGVLLSIRNKGNCDCIGALLGISRRQMLERGWDILSHEGTVGPK